MKYWCNKRISKNFKAKKIVEICLFFILLTCFFKYYIDNF